MIRKRIHKALRHVPPWTIYVAVLLWAAWLFYQALTGQMGPEPINALERAYGLLTLKLLVASLAVTPLQRFAGLNLVRFRRAIGLSAFYMVLAHIAVWAILDLQSISRITTELTKRPYIILGFTAFVLLVPVAATSNNFSMRRLRRNWGRLHRLVYVAIPLGGLHYIWLVKGWPWPPFAWFAAILMLLALRLVPRRRTAAV